jgi:hypothetical protein
MPNQGKPEGHEKRLGVTTPKPEEEQITLARERFPGLSFG